MITTVGQLRKALEGISDDTRIISTGADCGGYDVTLTSAIDIRRVEDRFPKAPATYWYKELYNDAARVYTAEEAGGPEPRFGPYKQDDNAFFYTGPFIIIEGTIGPNEDHDLWDEKNRFECARGNHFGPYGWGSFKSHQVCPRCKQPNPNYEG